MMSKSVFFAVALVALSTTATANSLRGLSGPSCPRIPCNTNVLGGGDYQSAMKSAAAKAMAACAASPNCVSNTRTLGSKDKGCFVAYKTGVITASKGFSGELRTMTCGSDTKVVPKLVIQKGAHVISVNTRR